MKLKEIKVNIESDIIQKSLFIEAHNFFMKGN